MVSLLVTLLLSCQEPSVAELLRRLDTGDIDVREKTEIELAARGAPALPEIEAALASADGAEFRLRLRRVIRKLRLADLTSRIPSQFGEGFRGAAPSLVDKLKHADPETLIECIALTTGRAWHWETEERKGSGGAVFSPRQLNRVTPAGVTRADAAEVIRLALRALPDQPLDERWQAVRTSAMAAILPADPELRRRLFGDLLVFRQFVDCHQILLAMVRNCREPADASIVLAALEIPGDLQTAASQMLLYLPPGPYSVEIEKRLAHIKPPMRRSLLYHLKLTGDVRYLKSFEEYMHSPQSDERAECATAIQKLAPASIPGHVLRWLRTGDAGKTRDALWLCRPKSPGAKPDLKGELLDEVLRVFKNAEEDGNRIAALHLLIQGQPPGLADLIVTAFSDRSPALRKAAVQISWGIPGDAVRQALEKLVSDADEELALAAIQSLFEKKIPPDLQRTRELMKSPQRQVRMGALGILVRANGEKAREEILVFLDDPEPQIQATVINYFQNWSAKGLEEKLRPKLRSPDEYVRLATARALSRIGDQECIPALKEGMGTWRWKEYLPLLMWMREPGWGKFMDEIKLKDPADGATVGTLIEEIRTGLKVRKIDVTVELPEEILKRRLTRYPLKSLAGYGVEWISIFAQGTYCFFDGQTLFVLTTEDARRRWLEWAKSE